MRNLAANSPQHSADSKRVQETSDHQGDDADDGNKSVQLQIFPPSVDMFGCDFFGNGVKNCYCFSRVVETEITSRMLVHSR